MKSVVLGFISTFTVYEGCATVASLASVYVWFPSKERPRNGIFGLAARKIRNNTETVATQASGTEFRYNIYCVGSLCYWIPSVHSLCAKSLVVGFIITFAW